MVQWPSPVLARSSRFRPMSPASQVGLEAYRFESCRERPQLTSSDTTQYFIANYFIHLKEYIIVDKK